MKQKHGWLVVPHCFGTTKSKYSISSVYRTMSRMKYPSAPPMFIGLSVDDDRFPHPIPSLISYPNISCSPTENGTGHRRLGMGYAPSALPEGIAKLGIANQWRLATYHTCLSRVRDASCGSPFVIIVEPFGSLVNVIKMMHVASRFGVSIADVVAMRHPTTYAKS